MLCMAAAQSVAGAQSTEGITLSPVYVEEDLETEQIERTFRVTNTQPEAQDVVVSVQGLGHDLDGNPTFPELQEGEAALVLDGPARFVLDAGETRPLRVTGRFGGRRPGIYESVVVELDERGAEPDGGVEVRHRVAAMLLLRGPGAWDESVRAEAAALDDNQDGTATVEVHVRNTGDVHVRPGGTAAVYDAAGAEIGTVQLESQLIIPELARRLAGEVSWPADAPDGPVRIDVELEGPADEASFTVEPTAGPPDGDAEEPESRDGGEGGAFLPGFDGESPLRPWPVAIALLLLLLVAALLIWAWRRQQGEQERPDASRRAASLKT